VYPRRQSILILGQIAPPNGDTSSAQTICFTKHSNQVEISNVSFMRIPLKI